MIAQDPTINYEDLGYNNRLQATDSLAATNENFVTATQFEAENDRNSISTYNVRNLNFGVMQGGTATLGGTVSGGGVLSVKNSAGSEIVRADSTGLTVNSGSIVLNNSLGSTSFDSLGVVSQANFVQTDSVYTGLNQSITGTAETDIEKAGVGTLTLTYVNNRTRSVIVLFNTSNWMNQSVGNIGNLTVRLKTNSNGGAFTEQARCINTGVTVTDGSGHTYSNFTVTNMTAGTKVLKLTAQLESVSGTPSATIYDARLAYIILGN